MKKEKLYNTMIIILSLGVIILISILVMIRPTPQPYTRFYFSNDAVLPDYIESNAENSFSITIENHEGKTINYQGEIIAELYEPKNISSIIYLGNFSITIEKDEIKESLIIYSLPTFYKAKVQAFLGGQKILFTVFNSNVTMEYNDTTAMIICLRDFNIEPSDNFTIRAKGSLSPNMKVRLDGKEIFSTVVNNTVFENFTIPAPIKNNILDIIFDNDFSNATAKMDRNLYIESITIKNKTIRPKEAILDVGKGASAFDCEMTKEYPEGMYWNSALRLRLT